MNLVPIDSKCIPEKLTMAKSDRDGGSLWLPVWMHALDTEAVIGYLLKNWVSHAEKQVLMELTDGRMSSEMMYRTGRLLGLLHDLGKVSGEFQQQITMKFPEILERQEAHGLVCRTRLGSTMKHAAMGQHLLVDGHEHEPGVLAVACVIGAHHGKPAERAAGELPYDPQGTWRPIQEAWIAYGLQQAGFAERKDLPRLSIPAQVMWTGLLIMADWIASNQTYFPLIPTEENGSHVDYTERKRNAFQKLHLTTPWIPEEVWDAGELCRERFGFEANAVQGLIADAATESDCPGIFILEAQMGVGKTEAALLAAEIIAAKTMHSGVYFGLPTQATANGIFGRLNDWAQQQAAQETHSLRLVHGAAELNEEYQALFEGCGDVGDRESGILIHEWFAGRKQALLADFVVGTVDQLLMAGLKQKHVMLRHLGLANKIVIVDECHAYDAYMNRYLETALHWLGAYHVPVILLSATLPADRRRDFILAYLNFPRKKQKDEQWMHSDAYPLLTWTDGDEVHQETRNISSEETEIGWEFAPWENDDFTGLAESLEKKMKQGGCVGVIVNTVKRAQACAENFRRIFSEKEVRVIHAQYLMPDRAAREKQLVQELGKHSKLGAGRPERLIVIGTQVLEQSLDIDFDYLVTDLCPMDLLLQRIGRLHRHKGRKRPIAFQGAFCEILCASEMLESGAEAVYGGYLLLRTKDILCRHGSLVLPRDISPLVQQTYDVAWDPADADDAYNKAKREEEEKTISKQRRAGMYCLSAPGKSKRMPYFYGKMELDFEEHSIQESRGTAAVRDGDPSIDVLCMRWGPDEKLYTFGDVEFQNPFSPDHTPPQEDAIVIARQRLRLPHILCSKYRIKETIERLEQDTLRQVSEWWYSQWLHGELFLLFDTEGNAVIKPFNLHYSRENGLEVQKEET